MTSIYCENHTYIGNACWYPSEEEAVDEWNIDSLTKAFLDGKMTWDETCAEARSLARPNACTPS